MPNYKQLIAIIIICIFGAYLRIQYFEVKFATPDEYRYQIYAARINSDGLLSGVRNLVQKFQEQKGEWLYPPPARVGSYIFTSLSQSITADLSTRAGAYVSTLASMLTLLTIILCGYVLAAPSLGIFAGLFYAISPVTLALARRAWIDSLGELLMALLFLTVLIIVKNKRLSVLPCITFFALCMYAFLMKESAYPVVALASFFGCLHFALARNWKSLLGLGALTIAAAVSGLLLLSFIIGGVDQLLLMYANMKEGIPTGIYAINYQDGPWYDLIKSYYAVAPAFVIYFGLCLAAFAFRIIDFKSFEDPNSIFRSALSLLLIVILFSTAVSIPLYFKNLRYMSPLQPLICLLAALAPASLLAESLRAGKNSLRKASFLIVISILIIAYVDLRTYHKVIVVPECSDLNLRMLRECKVRSMQLLP